MKTSYGLALMALSMISLLAVPALALDPHPTDGSSVPCPKGGFAGDQNWMLLVDGAARDNFENMTIAQMEELKQQKMQELDNMTLAEIRELEQQKMQELDNMTLAQIKEMGGKVLGMKGDGMMNGGMLRPGMAGIGGYSPEGQPERQMGGRW